MSIMLVCGQSTGCDPADGSPSMTCVTAWCSQCSMFHHPAPTPPIRVPKTYPKRLSTLVFLVRHRWQQSCARSRDCCQNRPRKTAPVARHVVTHSVRRSVNHIANARMINSLATVTAIAPTLRSNAPSRHSSSRSFLKAAVSFLRALAYAPVSAPSNPGFSTTGSSTTHPTSNALSVLYTSGP